MDGQGAGADKHRTKCQAEQSVKQYDAPTVPWQTDRQREHDAPIVVGRQTDKQKDRV